MIIKEFNTICLLIVSVSLLAQQKTIEVTGVVTDMNKEPLVGVNVSVRQTWFRSDNRYQRTLQDKHRGIFSFGIFVYWF